MYGEGVAAGAMMKSSEKSKPVGAGASAVASSGAAACIIKHIIVHFQSLISRDKFMEVSDFASSSTSTMSSGLIECL